MGSAKVHPLSLGIDAVQFMDDALDISPVEHAGGTHAIDRSDPTAVDDVLDGVSRTLREFTDPSDGPGGFVI
ncbi:MAG: hypothetical protein AAGB34_08740 [Planctomycetota bacterium]